MGETDTGLTDFITWSQIAFGVMAFVKVAKIDITFVFHTSIVCSFAPKFRSFFFTLLETDRGAEEPALDMSQQAFRVSGPVQFKKFSEYGVCECRWSMSLNEVNGLNKGDLKKAFVTLQAEATKETKRATKNCTVPRPLPHPQCT
ncbi:hypothetical protein CAPTEDRAFT_199756 [Capitella teleta]|uniref:Uncharacterized protein n=1 Tax=Capitella teleta TaxID=283909 RepID=R7TIT3_CAPTE|nr:hypothetical protein CAPTEDRAFT_199756 [Capitella teleta]|eukprot:ELT91451.1 hypothetical protein CAPTEDRAFT_199756 [Capitella teleta]